MNKGLTDWAGRIGKAGIHVAGLGAGNRDHSGGDYHKNKQRK